MWEWESGIPLPDAAATDSNATAATEQEAVEGGKIIYYRGRGAGRRGVKSTTASNKSVI